jgi:hypothetical protein
MFTRVEESGFWEAFLTAFKTSLFPDDFENGRGIGKALCSESADA